MPSSKSDWITSSFKVVSFTYVILEISKIASENLRSTTPLFEILSSIRVGGLLSLLTASFFVVVMNGMSRIATLKLKLLL